MSEPSREKQLEAILHSYLQGVDAGQNPDREDLLRWYPDFADELREYFADQAKIDRMALALNQAHVGDITLGTDEASTKAGGLPRIRYFGDYELLEEIARGGMGVVYKARQVSLKRLVALKMILSGEYAGPQELARFRTEGQAVASLQHQHIVQIYEVGEHEGHPYFSLEFCAGGNLAHKLDGTPLPARQAAQMVETLARTMHVAHQAGVVHRDLKPANVLLTADGTLKITDFGLAKKLEGEPGASAPGATASGAIMGTPSYMAPEQAAGKGKEAGPAADVYALGAILYEMLTGRPPFRAATPLETMLQVMADEPVSPSQLQRKTPKDLVTICLKCMQKEPGKRYTSALALAEDLRRFQAGEPILARPTRLPEKAVKWARRHPAVTAILATVFLIMFGSTIAVSWWLSQMVLTPTAADAPEIEEWRYPGAVKRFDSTAGHMAEGIQRGPGFAERDGVHMAIWITADDYNKVVSFYAAKLHLRHVEPDQFPDAQGSGGSFTKSPSGMFSKHFESHEVQFLLSDRMGKPSPGRERPEAAFRVGEKDPHPLRTHCLSRRTDSYLVTVTVTRAEDGKHTYIVLVYDVR
jgi:hypothetical protein